MSALEDTIRDQLSVMETRGEWEDITTAADAIRAVVAIVAEQKSAAAPARREHVLTWIEDAIARELGVLS